MSNYSFFLNQLRNARSKIDVFKQDHNQANLIISQLVDLLPEPLNKFGTVVWEGLEKEEDSFEKMVIVLEKLTEKNEIYLHEISEKLSKLYENNIRKSDIQQIAEEIRITNNSISKILDTKATDLSTNVKDLKNSISDLTKNIQERIPKSINFKTKIKKPTTFRGEKSSFFGRKNYLKDLQNLFTKPNKAITISGMGGIGKSSLAFKTIHECEDLFDVIIPVYFTSHFTVDEFLSDIQESVLQIPKKEFENHSLENRKQIVIKSLEDMNHPLIFVDNFDTLLDPSSTQQISEIKDFLNRIPNNSSILLTSRLKTNVDNEKQVLLDGLSLEEGTNLFLSLTKDRLKKVTEEIERTIKDLVKQTGGHPLSIEILARNYQGSGVGELKNMFNQLNNLDLDFDTTESRLRSIHACFDYSREKLERENQEHLPLLTIFNSPFTAEAAKSILNIDKKDLMKLHNRNFLSIIRSDNYGELDEDYYLYQFHPVIHSYLEGIAAKEFPNLEDQFSKKFSAYYDNLLKETDKSLEGSVMSPLIRWFIILAEGNRNDLLKLLSLSKISYQSVLTLIHIGHILSDLKRFQQSDRYFSIALNIFQKTKDGPLVAFVFQERGKALSRSNQLDRALLCFKTALQIHEKNSKKEELVTDYHLLGTTLTELHRIDEAMTYYNKALKILNETNNKRGIISIYRSMADSLFMMDRMNESLEYYKKTLESAKQIQIDEPEIGEIYASMAVLFFTGENMKESLEYNNKALKIFENHNNQKGIATIHKQLGDVFADISTAYNYSDKINDAIKHYDKALDIFQKQKDIPNVINVYRCIGLTYASLQKTDDAINYYNKALDSSKNVLDERIRAAIFESMADLYVELFKAEDALECLNNALKIYKKAVDPIGMVNIYQQRGELLKRIGKMDEGLEDYKRVSSFKNYFERIDSQKKSNFQSPYG